LLLAAIAPIAIAGWATFATWRHEKEEKIANAKLRAAVEEVDAVFTGAVSWGFTTLVATLKANGSWSPASQAEVKNAVREKVLATLTPAQIADFAAKSGITSDGKTVEEIATAVLPFIDSKIEKHVDTAKQAMGAANDIFRAPKP
jgi:hypothetical protein